MRPDAGAVPLGPTLSTRPSARAPCTWQPTSVRACAQCDCIQRAIQRAAPRAFTQSATVGKDDQTRSTPFHCLSSSRANGRKQNPRPYRKPTQATEMQPHRTRPPRRTRAARLVRFSDTCWPAPHSLGGRCAPPLGVLGNLRAEHVEHHAEKSVAGRHCSGPRRFRVVACEFLRSGWDSCDRLKKTDQKGERAHTLPN